MDYLKINQQLWDQKTEVHFNSDFYDVNAFLGGKESLKSIEKEILGDINGKNVLHLQCHFGQDSISLARLGAHVTGVDFSGKAIAKAQKLNELANTNVRFILSDVYKLPEIHSEKYDLIFTTYGVLGWLPDMQKWAKVVSHFLNPGAMLLLVEFHPVVWMFSNDFTNITYKYSDKEPIVEEIEGSYTDKSGSVTGKSIGWNHGLATVIQSLIDNGFMIRHFEEYNFSPYDCFNNTVETGEEQYKIKGLEDKLPMTYALKAEKMS